MWLVRVFGMTEKFRAECQQCSWSLMERSRDEVLDEAKQHRQAIDGHLVILSPPC